MIPHSGELGSCPQRFQILIDSRLEAGEGNPEVCPIFVRPGRHIDHPDLRHGLVHHVEDGLGFVGVFLLPGADDPDQASPFFYPFRPTGTRTDIPIFFPTLTWDYRLQPFRLHLASLPNPRISNCPSPRQRFITRRIVSRLTLGHSLSISAMPKGVVIVRSAYSTRSVFEPRSGRCRSARSSNSRYALRQVERR